MKKENDTYKIVAGERRWRAARAAGLETIPAIVKELTSKQVMEIALIENIQREDLNPIEEAEAYQRLIEEFELTQDELSDIIGKSRSSIANSVRLLSLCDAVKEYLVLGELTSGHARTLITIEDSNIQKKLADEIINNKLNVRDTENLVSNYINQKIKKKKINKEKDIYIKEIENSLEGLLGTKVEVQNKKNKGKIIIEYFSNEELNRLIEMMENINNKPHLLKQEIE